MTDQELNSGIEQILTNLLIEARRLADVEWECDVWALRGQIWDLFEQAGYVRLSPDQSLPKNPYDYHSEANPTPNENLENGCFIGFSRCMDDMLKANFRKVEELEVK